MSPTRPRRKVTPKAEAGSRPPKASIRPRHGRPGRATPAGRLAGELRTAESALHEAAAAFAARVAERLARVAAALETPPAPKRTVIAALAARLAETKLKPERGRLKDLARLQRLAEDLADLLPDA